MTGVISTNKQTKKRRRRAKELRRYLGYTPLLVVSIVQQETKFLHPSYPSAASHQPTDSYSVIFLYFFVCCCCCCWFFVIINFGFVDMNEHPANTHIVNVSQFVD